jgi:DNA-directed RNA polymerase subunit RPC12/RpoP
MKTCAYCGRENEDQATKCQECGTDFDLDPDSSEHIQKKPGETERLEKVAVLDNEVQAELIDGVLSGRDIPHIMQSYHDSALDGLFQAGKGWGVILAPASFKEEILTALADIKRQSQSSSGDPEGEAT